MIEIIPGILPTNIGELRGKASLVKDIVATIQFDMCDGIFVPTKTWPYNGKDEMAYREILNEENGLPYWEEVNYEFDLMVKNASKQYEEILKLGPTRIIFHIEAEDDLVSFFENLDPYHLHSMDFGVAINTTTDVLKIEPLLPYISFVQCMGIEIIGKQRQPFDDRVIGQIKKIRELYPKLIVSVDGAVSKKTAHVLVEAGATRLVIGSALFDEIDIQGAVENFQNLVT